MMLPEHDDEKISRAPLSPSQEREEKGEQLDTFGSQRVYKKTSSNQLLTLYLGTRELTARAGIAEPLKGVIYIDPKLLVSGHKVYGQLTLTFRYGREDEEVMGLKFCNEAVIALQQIWPKNELDNLALCPLQEALVERLGKNAVAFTMDVGAVIPPSVQLLPAKKYAGAPIGTSYDVRVYTAEQTDERIQRRSTVRLGIRLIHKICPETSLNSEPSLQTNPKLSRLRLSPKARKLIKQSSMIVNGSNSNRNGNKHGGGSFLELDETDGLNRGPQGSVDKPFLWAEGKVSLKASLNKSAYSHGENVNVTIDVKNDSRKVVRKIRIFAVQHVDVCMFSNGKFKNIVAELDDVSKQIGPNDTLHGVYSLLPVRGSTKNWIAVEGALFSTSNCDTSLAALNSKLASSAPRGITLPAMPSQNQSNLVPLIKPQASGVDEKNIFAIYVSYYIKVKLTLSTMGGEVTLKLPFILGNIENYGQSIDKNILPNHTNDLHLNDHQTLNDIRRPRFEKDDSTDKETSQLDMFSRQSSMVCKSIDQEDEDGIVPDLGLSEAKGIAYINQKLCELNQNDFGNLTRSDSSKSSLDDEVNITKEISAQVHCHTLDDN